MGLLGSQGSTREKNPIMVILVNIVKAVCPRLLSLLSLHTTKKLFISVVCVFQGCAHREYLLTNSNGSCQKARVNNSLESCKEGKFFPPDQ